MKHPASREFFGYWDKQRAGDAAPERSDLAPEGIRHLLGDTFVVSYDGAAAYPFRVAGTRVCALFGRDLKSQSFTGLFSDESKPDIEDIVGIVAEETLATVAGVTARGSDGSVAHLELLLLPFSARSHTPISMSGMLVPFGPRELQAYGALKDLSLTSWRHIGQEPRGPRTLRKWSVARGLTVYEGFR
ncbi:hypothetical protein V1291_001148 [Nitrobacteraceae bacterium AZCC 1564]